MSRYTASWGGRRQAQIVLGASAGSGVTGEVFRVVGRSSVVAKMYKASANPAQYEAKIEEMIQQRPDLPPLNHNGRDYVQIAWPEASIRDSTGKFCGFLMPEIDVGSATELENILQKSSRQHRKLPEFYGGRLLLAANLASLLAEMHARSHYFIDLKPLNVRFYPDSWYLAILDTDGFSIQGARRWPAGHFSDDYIAPEAKGLAPDRLGLEQDLFALAVIVFQLLNNGLHPYQGVDNRPGAPTTKQERIFANLYAYGANPPSGLRPAPSSIHEYLESSTHTMFDRAFTGNPAVRPSAREWSDHLRHLVTANIFRKCSKKPSEHGHFSKGCGLCNLEAMMAAAASQATGSLGSRGQMSGTAVGAPAYSYATGTAASPLRASASPPGAASRTRLAKWAAGILVAAGTSAAALWGFSNLPTVSAPVSSPPVTARPSPPVPTAAASCSFDGRQIAHSATVRAYRYASVAFAEECISEVRACWNGTLSGSFTNAECVARQATPPTPAVRTSCFFAGRSITHGTAVRAYKHSSVSFGEECVSETRTCWDGRLSGSFASADCSIKPGASCLLSGQTIADNTSVTAYRAPTVPADEQCYSETRRCSNGTLSGSYEYPACSVEASKTADCSFYGTVKHGDGVTSYREPRGNCVFERRTCNNGVLSGSYNFASCTPRDPAKCEFDGKTISHGGSVSAFREQSVPHGVSCNHEARTCNDGVLDGSYRHASCYQAPPAVCYFNGSAVLHGHTVTAFDQPVVGYDHVCRSQERRCDNGTLLGNYTYPDCKQSPPATPAIYFSFSNSSGYEVMVNFKGPETGRQWPGGGRVWVMAPGGSVQLKIDCSLNERVCWGASAKHTNHYWGISVHHNQSCRDCCHRCEIQTFVPITLTDR